MKYSEIRGDLKTGDIVLFSGKGLVSAGIKAVTNSEWSHVGMVLRVPEYNFVCIWESTTLNKIEDLTTNTLRRGVQLIMLSDRLRSYAGKVAVRHLLGGELSADQQMMLLDLRQEVAGRAYEQDEWELIKSAYDGPFGKNSEDLSTLFCSELIAEAYQRLGLLNEVEPSNEYTPADFSEKNELCLLGGFYLGKEIVVEVG